MFCTECGTKVADTAKFCFNCGTKLFNEEIVTENNKEVISDENTDASKNSDPKDIDSFFKSDPNYFGDLSNEVVAKAVEHDDESAIPQIVLPKFDFDVSNVVFVTQNENFLNVYTQGMFTPLSLDGLGSQLGGCATGGNDCLATETSVRWSFTRSGSALSGYSVSASGTLNSPYAPLEAQVLEPVIFGLFGIGLLGLAAARRRKAA